MMDPSVVLELVNYPEDWFTGRYVSGFADSETASEFLRREHGAEEFDTLSDSQTVWRTKDGKVYEIFVLEMFDINDILWRMMVKK